jgi:Kazal-type serine protease inhibitor-like protein
MSLHRRLPRVVSAWSSVGSLCVLACAHAPDAPTTVPASSSTAPQELPPASDATSAAGATTPADAAPAGAGIAAGPAGANCGGIAGLRCEEGLFCDYPVSAHCGAADQTGTCQPKPQMCTKIYKAVCGCDGKTHGNACEARGAGVSVASEGECSNP